MIYPKVYNFSAITIVLCGLNFKYELATRNKLTVFNPGGLGLEFELIITSFIFADLTCFAFSIKFSTSFLLKNFLL